MDSILKRTMYECSNVHYLHCFFVWKQSLRKIGQHVFGFYF